MPEAKTAPAADTAAKSDSSARRTQRRFARRQWRRRWLRWKPLLLGFLVLALLGGAIWAVWFSSFLAVQSVVVSGTATLTPAEVRRAAAITAETPLANVDLGKTRDRVAAMAAVESVTVSRRWPDQVVITVTERTPIAVIKLGKQLRGLDREGVVFDSYRKAPANLPTVVSPAGTDARALREAAHVVSALPEPIAKITDHVSVETADEISLALTGGRTVEWGSSADSLQKADVLVALLRHEASVYDVSVPGQPTTR